MFISYGEDTISTLKVTKGDNSIKNVGTVSVLVFCTSAAEALYVYHFHEISSAVLKIQSR